MLYVLNKKLEKLMPVITPSAVVIGVFFAHYLSSFTYIVPWVFAFMTFSGSLSSNFNSLQRTLKFPLPLLTALLILHIIMPLWAFGMGSIAFPSDGMTVTGLLLAMVIPTGITSFVWVTIYKGNIGLALSIILVDTILSPFIVPASLSMIVGQKVEMNSWSIMSGLLWMVVIPSLTGMLCNHLTKGSIKDTVGRRLSPFSKIGIGVVVAINSSAVAPYLLDLSWKLFFIAFVVLFVAISGFTIAWLLGTLLKQSRETKASLLFTGGMRNISAGAVIAVQYFPAAVAVPVVIGMLFQQVLASLFGFLFQRQEIKMKA
ncbi:bile acid:sodium symporter family protein [Bacillus haikouensis]|uniref:bile acid:sodium symporter family protein n=1 Tax=Bacillus haikouensis TaxID=1510468 RepID=UPI0015551C47|nr:bile acid:sodium symporter family protein [Bacillus haikouensis]NQD65170.1 bile acid:sodium symporter family protein [Bacillus haikouensis]